MEDLKILVGTQLAEMADQAVELLNIKGFINTHLDPIEAKLEECDHYAQNPSVNNDMIFIALTLPVINGIIHIASNRRDMIATFDWLTREWKNDEDKAPEKMLVLTTLTLVYVVAIYWGRYKNDPDHNKREIWQRICGRVQKLSGESLDKETQE